jgi:hypothetical protein
MNAIMNPDQKPNGSGDLLVPELSEPAQLRIQVEELQARLRELQSHEAKSSSEAVLELPAGTSRDDLVEYVFKLQRKIFDLQEALQGRCTRCGKAKNDRCISGTVEIAEGHGGRHMICANLKDGELVPAHEQFSKPIKSPGPVNAGFFELMHPETTNETAPVAAVPKDRKPK